MFEHTRPQVHWPGARPRQDLGISYILEGTFSGIEWCKGKQAPPACIDSGGMALMLHPTQRLGFLGRRVFASIQGEMFYV